MAPPVPLLSIPCAAFLPIDYTVLVDFPPLPHLLNPPLFSSSTSIALQNREVPQAGVAAGFTAVSWRRRLLKHLGVNIVPLRATGAKAHLPG